jgi:transcriptional regulator with XRE-family HTH domain
VWSGYCESAMTTNRIAELRLLRGWTQEELAQRVGTTKMTISRLERGPENGGMHLTVEWMQRLAKSFGVHAGQLLDMAMLAEIVDEVAPAPLGDLASLGPALQKRGLRVYNVTGDNVTGAGINPGDVITVDESPEAIAAIQTGDIALAEVTAPQRGIVLRQWVAPDILLTNRPGAKIAMGLSDTSVSVRVIGVVIRG